MNTSEMVDMEKRLEITDKYVQKLINSEYTLEQTRCNNWRPKRL